MNPISNKYLSPALRRLAVAGAAAAVVLAAGCARLPAAPSAGESPLPTPLMSPLPTEANVSEPSPTPLPSTVKIDPELAIPAAPRPTPLAADAEAQRAARENPAVRAAVDALSQELAVDGSAIVVLSVEEVEWPDGCLGVRTPGVMCLQVITPGYRVTLEFDGQQYVYHTDATGQQVVKATRVP